MAGRVPLNRTFTRRRRLAPQPPLHGQLATRCAQSLGAQHVTALMFADPGDFSGSAEAKHILANLKNKKQVAVGSTVCGNRFTGKLLGQDVTVITTGAPAASWRQLQSPPPPRATIPPRQPCHTSLPHILMARMERRLPPQLPGAPRCAQRPPARLSRAGIGDTAAGLCAYEVLLTCGAHIKEIIYFGTSGWSPAKGGLLDADKCDAPNTAPQAAR
jgi:hypothetical protein